MMLPVPLTKPRSQVSLSLAPHDERERLNRGIFKHRFFFFFLLIQKIQPKLPIPVLSAAGLISILFLHTQALLALSPSFCIA